MGFKRDCAGRVVCVCGLDVFRLCRCGVEGGLRERGRNTRGYEGINADVVQPQLETIGEGIGRGGTGGNGVVYALEQITRANHFGVYIR